MGERQLVEIARALRLGSRFVILDEPTARLEASEVARLFEHMRRLQADGVAFLYISHHLEEIYEVCDTVTILRDGVVVTSAAVGDLVKDEIVAAMVGPAGAASSFNRGSPVRARPVGETVLPGRDLTVDGWCEDISFEVRAGEFVGARRLAGCGKAQVAEPSPAWSSHDGGDDRGRASSPSPPGRADRAIALGIGFVPGDRHARGFCANLSTEENLT